MYARSVVSAVLLALVAVLAPAPAQAETIVWRYGAGAGGSQVHALGMTVHSDVTALSAVSGGPAGRTATNRTTSVQVAHLLNLGAVETRADSIALANGGVRLRTWARTASVDLLDGLVRADAVETTVTTTGLGDGSSTSTGGTKLVGLKIVGLTVPVEIPENFVAVVPGVAVVTANRIFSIQKGTNRATRAWALGINLLQDRAGFSAGTKLILNPTTHLLTEAVQAPGRLPGGGAYATQVAANVGDAVEVRSDPTARVYVPWGGSQGETLTNTTAGVNVPGVLRAAGLRSTSTSDMGPAGFGSATNTSETLQVNLLNGLITADAIEVSAHSRRENDVYSGDLDMRLVNLRIAGQPIDVDVAPNTTIDVAGVAKVVVNQQMQLGSLNLIRGLYVTLTTEQAGLPVGATIEVSAAISWVQ